MAKAQVRGRILYVLPPCFKVPHAGSRFCSGSGITAAPGWDTRVRRSNLTARNSLREAFRTGRVGLSRRPGAIVRSESGSRRRRRGGQIWCKRHRVPALHGGDPINHPPEIPRPSTLNPAHYCAATATGARLSRASSACRCLRLPPVGLLHRPEAADHVGQLRDRHRDIQRLRPQRRQHSAQVADILLDQRPLHPPLLLPAEQVERRPAQMLAVPQHAEQRQRQPARQRDLAPPSRGRIDAA